MNFIDLIILIVIGYFAYKGFRNGLVIEVCTLLALLVGIYVGIHFSDGTAHLLKEKWAFDSPYLPTIAFTLTFLAIGAMVYFGGKFLEKVVSVAGLSIVNKLLGVAFAILKALYLLSVLIVIFESYDEKAKLVEPETKTNAMLYYPIKDLSESTIPQLKESSIYLQNAFKSESDSTGLTVQEVLRAKEIADSLGMDANDAIEIKRIHDEYSAK